MMKKAKTYLASIEKAATERELLGIEIQFKQDMTIACDDLGKLCRAAVLLTSLLVKRGFRSELKILTRRA